MINNNCNDYFLCNDCYKSDNLLYTFDAAFESNFKCNCGKNLARMDKTEAEIDADRHQVIPWRSSAPEITLPLSTKGLSNRIGTAGARSR